MKLAYGFHFSKGRDNTGRISSFHRGGGNKRLYRIVDFSRHMFGVRGKIIDIVKDPHRSSELVLIAYTNKILSYQLAVEGVSVGDYLTSHDRVSRDTFLKKGDTAPLNLISAGERICNLECTPYTKGKVARSAGSFVKLIKKYDQEGLVRLPSGEYRLFSLYCKGTLGRIGNVKHKEKIAGKAGVVRQRGWRPIVRGIAMNPVDHPHGGRTNGGKIPVTPWGRIAKGVKTCKKKSNKRIF